MFTCVAVSPSNFRLCALRERDKDGPNFAAEFRSSSRAAVRFLSSTTDKNISKIFLYLYGFSRNFLIYYQLSYYLLNLTHVA